MFNIAPVVEESIIGNIFWKIKNQGSKWKNKIINDIDIFKESAYRKYKISSNQNIFILMEVV